MTWAKYDTGFFAQCADAGLSDAATLTHTQAVHWLYQCDRQNVMDMSIPAKAIPRFASSDDWAAAVAQLVHLGFWAEAEGGFVLVHHAEVVRSSLTFQRKKKETDRRAQAAARKRAAAKKEVSDDVIDDVSGDAYIHTEHSFIDVGSQSEQLPDGGWGQTSVAQPPQPAPDYSFLEKRAAEYKENAA